MMCLRRVFPLWLAGLWMLCSQAPLAAQAPTPADLVPEDIGIFIECRDLASTLAGLADTPLAEAVGVLHPARRTPEAWQAFEDQLGMSGDQILRHFMGRPVAYVAEWSDHHVPGALVCQIDAQTRRLLIQRLSLRSSGQTGAFTFYEAPDRATLMALSDQWALVTAERHRPYLGMLVNRIGRGRPLAQDPDFRRWMDQLPQQCEITGFLRDPESDWRLSFGLTRDGADLTLHAYARTPLTRQMAARSQAAEAVSYGPLPEQILAAVSLQMEGLALPHGSLIDRLIAPRTFGRDIAPRLSAPMVAFVGQVPRDMNERDPGMHLPVLGVAFKLRDPAVVAELDRLSDGLVLLANIGTAGWDAPMVYVTPGRYRGASYRAATLGHTLAQRSRRRELAQIELVAGQVGSWYVMSTHRRFHHWCLDVAAGQRPAYPARTLQASDPDALTDEEPRNLLAHAVLHTPRLHDQVENWLGFIKRERPFLLMGTRRVSGPAPRFLPASAEARMVRRTARAVGSLAAYDDVEFTLEAVGEGVVHGRLHLPARKVAAP